MKDSNPEEKQLRTENASLKREVKALKEQLEQSENYIAAVIHDLKSPMIAIKGLARHLLGKYENPDGPKAKIVKQIEQIATPLERLIENVNQYMATKKAPLKVEELDIQEVFELIRDEFEFRLQSRGITLYIPDEAIRLRVSRLSIWRIIKNLVENAINYGGRTLTKIVIKIDIEETHYLFSVFNNGERISKKNCYKIFQQYERISCSGGVEGYGMGLASVKAAAKRNGGDAWAEPGKKRGVTFYFSISKSL